MLLKDAERYFVSMVFVFVILNNVLPHPDMSGGMQFDVIMVDVAAPDPAGDPGTLNSIPAHFLSAHFVVEGLQRRLR